MTNDTDKAPTVQEVFRMATECGVAVAWSASLYPAIREDCTITEEITDLVNMAFAAGAKAHGIAPPDGMALVHVESLASSIADLQPLGLSQNRADRLWQLYRTPEECIADVKKAMLAAAPKPTPEDCHE